MDRCRGSRGPCYREGGEYFFEVCSRTWGIGEGLENPLDCGPPIPDTVPGPTDRWMTPPEAESLEGGRGAVIADGVGRDRLGVSSSSGSACPNIDPAPAPALSTLYELFALLLNVGPVPGPSPDTLLGAALETVTPIVLPIFSLSMQLMSGVLATITMSFRSPTVCICSRGVGMVVCWKSDRASKFIAVMFLSNIRLRSSSNCFLRNCS